MVVRIGWCRGTLAYARTRCAEYMEDWFIVVLLSLGPPLVYIFALGYGLGNHISTLMDGMDYLPFVASGAMVGTVATILGGFGLWPVVHGFEGTGQFPQACNAPLMPSQVALGEVTAVSIRVGVQATAFWLVGVLLHIWPLGMSVFSIPASLLTGLALYTPLMAVSARYRGVSAHFLPIYRIFSAFYLLGGAFVPIKDLPGAVQIISMFSPITYGLTIARGAIVGGGSEVVYCVGILTLVSVVGMIAATRSFTYRIIL